MLRIFLFVLVSVVVSGCALKLPKFGKKDTGPTIAYAEVFKDYAQQAEKYHKSAQQGDANAQYNLGYLYKNVAKDYGQAHAWYMKSATQGNAKAQNNLAVLYAEGQGVDKDYKKAYMWFNISVANGYEEATRGKFMLQSRMLKQDKVTATEMAVACVKSKYQNCQ